MNEILFSSDVMPISTIHAIKLFGSHENLSCFISSGNLGHDFLIKITVFNLYEMGSCINFCN